ncbi:MAG: aminomethyl-transferring glycine dehydrogenase subunit GcvPA [Aliivibrio sp.]|uniref:aminomethyl-transferring glycine dehydrogenase subunit GcvPA n=1 Tax=Aliivibrio sp. TaxID=1872443 RepID=UPI001A518A7E|nr:aminomethyl-transferring glycine dehydrogenase subunit GcvPA [Aliivibrio sp.]
MEKQRAHPYIPNSDPSIKEQLLKAIGVSDVEELLVGIPKSLRMDRRLNLPESYESEFELKRHVQQILNKNSSCDENLSFLGGGCYQHHVPAICDEINGRSEFLTAYAGEPYDDHGRFQTLFEYCSMMTEMLDMEVVNVPCYDGYQASATSVCMAGRYTNRSKVLVSENINPDKFSMMQTYCRANVELIKVPMLNESGLLDQSVLKSMLSDEIAAVYFEVPSFLGQIEDGQILSDLAHAAGALVVVSVNPSSLGSIAPPAKYGADIVCGDIQPLGIHMQYGGGQGGFIASHDNPDMIAQYPSRLFGIIPTIVDGEYGFGDVAYDRTSFGKREEGNEFVGTAAALWGITAGVYMALMGPHGMQELAEGILQKTKYAMNAISKITALSIPFSSQYHYNEFVVNFDKTGKTVKQINEHLRSKGIFAGHDLSESFPQLGQSALYCFSEIHSQKNIDDLIAALKEMTK